MSELSEPLEVQAHIKSLNDRRIRANAAGMEILDRAADAKRGLLASEQRSIEKIDAEIAEIEGERDVYASRERRQREFEAMREATDYAFGGRRVAAHDDAEARSLRSWMQGEGSRYLAVPIEPAAREVAALRAAGGAGAEFRALAWDTGSVASTVPTTLQRTLYQYLEASVSMVRAPTTKWYTDGGEPTLVPQLTSTGHAIATQISGQGTVIAGTDPAFTRTQFDAFKYGEIVRVSAETLTDAAVDLAAFLGRDIGRGIGRLVDQHLVVGTGTGQPRGLMVAMAAAGAGSITTGGTAINPTYEKYIDALYNFPDEYRNGGACAWMVKDSTVANIRKIRDQGGGTIGAAMWQPSQTAGLSGGQPDMWLGFPIYSDPNIASLGSNQRVAYVGDMSAYYIRIVKPGVIIERDASRYFDTDEVGFRGKMRVDGDSLDLSSGCTIVMNV